MKLIIISSLLISIAAMGNGHSVPVGPDVVFQQNTKNNEIKMMSYNVLNLFDTEKDPYADDWAFLPANYPNKQAHCESERTYMDKKMCRELDWNDARLNMKIQQIAQIVRFQGTLPDVLALVEVESAAVIEKVAQALGYDDYSVTDSRTSRGTDVALLFKKNKLARINDQSLNVTMPGENKTRDILRVDFQVKGVNGILSVYVNHWPAQSHPAINRAHAAQQLAADIDNQAGKFRKTNYYAVAIGDFNVIDSDSPNAFSDVLYSKNWSNSLFDGHYIALQTKTNPALPYMPSGTYFYNKNSAWNLLDHVAMTKNLYDGTGTEFLPESYRILFPAFMSFNSNGNRVPYSYNFFANTPETAGYSDHLPVVFKIKL